LSRCDISSTRDSYSAWSSGRPSGGSRRWCTDGADQPPTTLVQARHAAATTGWRFGPLPGEYLAVRGKCRQRSAMNAQRAVLSTYRVSRVWAYEEMGSNRDHRLARHEITGPGLDDLPPAPAELPGGLLGSQKVRAMRSWRRAENARARDAACSSLTRRRQAIWPAENCRTNAFDPLAGFALAKNDLGKTTAAGGAAGPCGKSR